MSFSESDYYRLRTEWLRFKSYLFDSLTGLPALPAVIEDVRRLADARHRIDVISLDLGRSAGGDTRLGWSTFDRGVKAFGEVLAALRTGHVLHDDDVICLHSVRSDRFLIFAAVTGEEAGNSEATRSRVLRSVRQSIGGTSPGNVLRLLKLSSGSSRVRENPMVRVERAILQAVSEAMQMAAAARQTSGARCNDDLHQLIVHGAVRTVFDPIVRLETGTSIGHEALTRPLRQTSFESVEDLFAFAESSEYLLEFERLCRSTAIRSATRHPHCGLLFLNTSPGAVEDPDWKDGSVDRLLSEHGLSPREVVVEITERTAVDDNDAFQGALKTFKRRGYRVAVDDMGAGYASLQTLAAVQPDFLKFDTSLVRDIDRSSIKRGLLDSLRTLAEKISARVIAEGIEREEELQTLLAMGIELGQGYYFRTAGEE